jgi:hypothetical protein
MNVAEELNLDPLVIQAFMTEDEEAMLPSGEPVIRFHRHLFSRFTQGKYDRKYPYISNPNAGGYIGGDAEHEKLAKAKTLNQDAAWRATSWGLFQLPGAGHARAGFVSLHEFVNAMYRGRASQESAFVAFVKGFPRLYEALQTRNWSAAGRLYHEAPLPRHFLLGE